MEESGLLFFLPRFANHMIYLNIRVYLLIGTISSNYILGRSNASYVVETLLPSALSAGNSPQQLSSAITTTTTYGVTSRFSKKLSWTKPLDNIFLYPTSSVWPSNVQYIGGDNPPKFHPSLNIEGSAGYLEILPESVVYLSHSKDRSLDHRLMNLDDDQHFKLGFTIVFSLKVICNSSSDPLLSSPNVNLTLDCKYNVLYSTVHLNDHNQTLVIEFQPSVWNFVHIDFDRRKRRFKTKVNGVEAESMADLKTTKKHPEEEYFRIGPLKNFHRMFITALQVWNVPAETLKRLRIDFEAESSPTSNNNNRIPNVVYNLNKHHGLWLQTESRPQTNNESLHLKFRTLQSGHAVLAYKRTYKHSFQLELINGRLVFRFTDDSDLKISSYSLPSTPVNDGEWHSLVVSRKFSTFQISIDNQRYSDVSFAKTLNENVFAGGVIALGIDYGPNKATPYNGDIGDVYIIVNGHLLPTKELPGGLSGTFSELSFPDFSNGVDKVIIRVDMAPRSSVAFRRNDPPVRLQYSEDYHLDSFGATFKTMSDGIIASLVSDSSSVIGLEVLKGQLILLVKDTKLTDQVQRSAVGAVDYNAEHTIHLRIDRQRGIGTVNARLNISRSSNISATIANPFIIKSFIFGGEQRNSPVFESTSAIVGCISKIYLNMITLNLQSLVPGSRSDCSLVFKDNSAFGNRPGSNFGDDHVEAIMFRQSDQPLPFTYAENDRKAFQSLSLEFSTIEPSGIVASLHDTGDNLIALYFKNGTLYLTIDDENIVQQSFQVFNKPINDGKYHKIRLINDPSSSLDRCEVDGRIEKFPQPLTTSFSVTTIYFGAADNLAKKRSDLSTAENFIGCMRNILFNGDHLIRNDHVNDKSRINAQCVPMVRPRIPTVVYLKPDVSFSFKNRQDALHLNLPNSEEFSTLLVPLSTVVNDAVVASLGSTLDKRTVILYIQSGTLNVAYNDKTGKELHLSTGKIINDGKEHKIRLSRFPVTSNLDLIIDNDTYSIDLPTKTTPLFFDSLTIGGTNQPVIRGDMNVMQDKEYTGCFQNIQYNNGSIVPLNVVSKKRHQCQLVSGLTCDATKQCVPSPSFAVPKLRNQIFNSNYDTRSVSDDTDQPNSFCPSKRCSLLCQLGDRSFVTYKRRIPDSNDQKLSFMIRTDAGNAMLFRSSGSMKNRLEIWIKNGHVHLDVEKDGTVRSFKFPPRNVSDTDYHSIGIAKHRNQFNLTIDGESVSHDVRTLSLQNIFGNELTLCNGRYHGYIQDVTLSWDNALVDLLQEIISRPELFTIGDKVTWEDRYSIRKRAAILPVSSRIYDDIVSPCSKLNCRQGMRRCRLRRSSDSSRKQLCICVDAQDTQNSRCEGEGDRPLESDLDRTLDCCLRSTTTIASAQELCSSESCRYGTCSADLQGKPICHCSPGFIGDHCDEQVDPCQSSPCRNGGTCFPQGPLSFACYCTVQFTGTYCEMPAIQDPCEQVRCNNGGYCAGGGCRCQEGFSGKFCEVVLQRDMCSYITCQHGGTCSDGRCICPPMFTGAFCETTDPCYAVNCMNGGQCDVGRCRCHPGYSGDFCERSPPPPMEPTDPWIYNPPRAYQDPCTAVTCFNGGECRDGRCVCPAGMSGPRCESVEQPSQEPPRYEDSCQEISCANQGYCDMGTCVCSTGFEGRYCEEIIDHCVTVQCLNGGHCKEGTCICHPSYSGSYCEVADLCYGVNCIHGSCLDGHCNCQPGFTGVFCEEAVPILPGWSKLEQPQAGLIDYGKVPRSRGKHLGAILAIASGLALGALAGAFAARKCAEGACSPGGGVATPIPVNTSVNTDSISNMIGSTVPTQFVGGGGAATTTTKQEMYEKNVTEDRERLLPDFDAHMAGGDNMGAQTEKIETIHERLVEADLFDATGGMGAGGAASFVYHPPPIADFGYSGSAVSHHQSAAYSDAEAWEKSGIGAGINSLHMNQLAPGIGPGSATDFELSNINTLTMTPNGKYAIVGQAQGPPQIWDAQNGNLINSMYGNCSHCTQLALACNGTLLVGLSGDVTDTQPCVVQIWDVNTGRPIHLSHQVKCSAFTLSNNTNNLVMAGNQKYGRGVSVGILDLVSNELTKELKSDKQMAFGRDPSFIALTPDERHAIIGCFNVSQGLTNFVVFDLTTNADIVQPAYISLDCDPKRCVVLNNRECISGINNGQLFVWDLITCKPVHYFSDGNLDRTAHRSQITDVKLSPDKSLLITASKDGTAKVWDTNGRNLLTRLLGHHSDVTCACLTNNQLLATTGSRDQTICLWRLPSGQMAAQMSIGMVPTEVHMANQNRTVVAIAEKDGERQLLMLRVVSGNGTDSINNVTSQQQR